MLQIQDIRKKYVTGDLVQTALDGVSLNFRDSEFVAILGPSGSGKTTLLNVIGGLDRYDSGDLIINGISTKKYTDRDWDSYRNHTIGFVFQSYNLIPHQSVLANVELALTISGISGAQRRQRAAEALEAVGLGNQLHKRPSQMSGGQMQRVAIARALVNNPDILLADEPTGALDSETSIQVMELLKQVSKDRLVIMVTHNPELAMQYANRVVRFRDGRILDDSNPFTPDAADTPEPQHRNMGRAAMSFATALSLSFNNLRTKKGRTLLTAFAGSIGIIGIALIMALSSGFQRYVDKIQEDTLSSYPLVIRSETANMTAAMASFSQSFFSAGDPQDGTVQEQPMISQMFASMGSNDLGAFKAYMEENADRIGSTINALHYGYGIRPYVFAEDTSQGVQQVNPGNLFTRLMNGFPMASYMDTDLFQEMVDNRSLLESQYDVLQGRWPEKFDEVVVVLSDPTQISDYMAYTLGLRDTDTLSQMIQRIINGEDPSADPHESMQWTYDDLMGLRFRLVNAADMYQYNESYQVWEDMSGDSGYMKKLIDSAQTLSVVGIIAPKEGSGATALSQGIAYTCELTDYVIQQAKDSPIVQNQLSDEGVDVFTGVPFGSDKTSDLDFEDMIHIDGDMLSSAFGMNISESAILELLETYLEDAAGSMNIDTQPALADFTAGLEQMSRSMLNGYVDAHADASGAAELRLTDAEAIVQQYLDTPEAAGLIESLSQKYQLPADTFQRVYHPLLLGLVSGYVANDMANVVPPEQVPEGTHPDEPTAAPEPAPTAGEEAPTEQDPSGAADIASTDPAPLQTEAVPQLEKPTLPEISFDPALLSAKITHGDVDEFVPRFLSDPAVAGTANVMSAQMVRPQAQQQLLSMVSEFGSYLLNYIGSSFYVDTDKIASAFEFEMNEEELSRLLNALSSNQSQQSAAGNLRKLGYADPEQPTSISIYFSDFAGKETFLRFLDEYNDQMAAQEQDDLMISYTDLTGMMMDSVRTVIDSVSYVLIAFVAVSLVVSSIMIGIITYISVMERTKEIGILRAIGASKHNISQVFNAETFIIGMCSGLLGVGISLLLLLPCNYVIHNVLGNANITAQLPMGNALILIVLSMLLTMVGGLIPSQKAAQKDPVVALRSE